MDKATYIGIIFWILFSLVNLTGLFFPCKALYFAMCLYGGFNIMLGALMIPMLMLYRKNKKEGK